MLTDFCVGEGDIARKDPKYKRYTANIEKALVLFETHALQEWADYISFLVRLLKVVVVLVALEGQRVSYGKSTEYFPGGLWS